MAWHKTVIHSIIAHQHYSHSRHTTNNWRIFQIGIMIVINVVNRKLVDHFILRFKLSVIIWFFFVMNFDPEGTCYFFVWDVGNKERIRKVTLWMVEVFYIWSSCYFGMILWLCWVSACSICILGVNVFK